MKKRLKLVSVFTATSTCIIGCVGSSGSNSNSTTSLAIQSTNTANTSTTTDPSKIGFAIQFNNLSPTLQIAYGPYYDPTQSGNASSCPNSSDIYNTTITPVLNLSSGSSLASLWQNYEYFNCNAGITKLVVNAINSAKNSIYVAAYDFSNPDIAYALIQQKLHGVDVQVILDSSNTTASNSMMKVLADNNIPVYISSAYSIMHNKFMVIDKSAVEFGSLNYTIEASTQQANNAMVVQDSSIVSAYLSRWNEILSNQKTASYADGDWTPSTAAYVPPGYTAPTSSTKTTSATSFSTLNLNSGNVLVVQDLTYTASSDANTVSSYCTSQLSSIGVCQTNYNSQPLVNLINSATTSIKIAAMLITDKNIATALINAANNGVAISVVADSGQNSSLGTSSQLANLQSNGISVRLNSNYEILHDKYMIVDDATVETGSYNYSSSAYSANAENYTIFYNQPQLAQLYDGDFTALYSQGTDL